MASILVYRNFLSKKNNPNIKILLKLFLFYLLVSRDLGTTGHHEGKEFAFEFVD